MASKHVPFDDFAVKAHHLWDKQWLLLTAGDFNAGHFNTMTVGWGGLGTMWGKPFALVVVRPHRHTFGFMEQYDTFTLCAFPDAYREALNLLGTRSGRDGDKIADAKLTPIASAQIASPAFAEAELVLECRKIYWDDMDPAHFIDPAIHAKYPQQDYHRIYFGEIVAVWGQDI